jgi:hypothetical protein
MQREHFVLSLREKSREQLDSYNSQRLQNNCSIEAF